MSIVETVNLISSILNMMKNSKYTDLFTDYETMELSEIYCKSRKLFIIFYSDDIDQVIT